MATAIRTEAIDDSVIDYIISVRDGPGNLKLLEKEAPSRFSHLFPPELCTSVHASHTKKAVYAATMEPAPTYTGLFPPAEVCQAFIEGYRAAQRETEVPFVLSRRIAS